MHHDAFAGRPALVHAQIFVGVEFALPVEHADFPIFMNDNTSLAVGELRNLGYVDFRHVTRPLVSE
jgi:hypothetical protein